MWVNVGDTSRDMKIIGTWTEHLWEENNNNPYYGWLVNWSLNFQKIGVRLVQDWPLTDKYLKLYIEYTFNKNSCIIYVVHNSTTGTFKVYVNGVEQTLTKDGNVKMVQEADIYHIQAHIREHSLLVHLQLHYGYHQINQHHSIISWVNYLTLGISIAN